MRYASAALVIVACLLSGCEGAERGARFSVTPIAFPGGTGSGQAHLAALGTGDAVLSWLEPAADDAHALRFAVLTAAGDWGETGTVVGGRRFFVNWADFPSVVPVTADYWVAHWLELQPDSYGAYDAFISVSNDAGRTWTDGVPLNEDRTEAEHGFVELFAVDGQAQALWLDGRELANWSFDNPDQLLAVSLRVASIGSDGSVADRRIVDSMVCDCCQPDVAIASRRALVTYRDRTEDEIRDIVVRVRDPDGWSAPLDVSGEGWRIEGCPVNGPAIDAAGDHVGIGWFTAAGDEPRVRFARSADGGRRFGDPIDVDADGAFGQVDVVVAADGGAVLSWWRRGADGGIDLAVRALPAAGEAGPIRIVAHETVSQPIDVPQLLPVGDRLAVVWTSFDGDGIVKAVLIQSP